MTPRAKLLTLAGIVYVSCSFAAAQVAQASSLPAATESTGHLFVLAALALAFLFVPIMLIMFYATRHPKHDRVVAAATGALVWIALMAAQEVIGVTHPSYWLPLDYLFNVALSAYLVLEFRFPQGYLIVGLLLAWLGPLYFLIFGPLRVASRSTTVSAHR